MRGDYWKSHHEAIPEETLEILNEFLLSLKLSNKAQATIVKYKRILEQFLSECRGALPDLTSDDVLVWLNAFKQNKKQRTIDLYLSCLSTFFQFCLEEEIMEQMVLKKRWRPKITESLPKYLTEAEYAKVRLAAEELSLRNRAIILFLFSSGCRRGELCHLLIEDVDIKKRTAQVMGKGKHIRYIHFSVECAIVLQAYLDTRAYEPTEPLFMNENGDALGPSGVFKITRQLGEKAGLEQTLHPHVCRHTFATNMLARGADLSFIADEMGHADLNTTRVYARIPTEDMKSAYQNKMG